MPIEHFCLSCSKTFATVAGLTSHARAKGHVANPFVCDACEVSFASSMALESHMNSPRHADDYASDDDVSDDDVSDDDVSDDDASDADDVSDDASFDDSDSAEGDPYCSGCERQFVCMNALNQHLFDSPKHNWCFDCSRDFSSETALLNHQNSLAHRGRDFQCPFCNGMFKSPSGIAQHIESGCHKITRHQVTAAVRKLQIVPDISIKRITGPVDPPTTIRTYFASEASFDGSAYKCYLCSKSFRTLAGLNSHLNSPAHDDDEFRCPKCKTEFKLISGFVQHLESRSCGLAETPEIDNYFNDLTSRFSRLLKM
ncbi:hypothetical protein BJ912DRAFT_993276 [Pholiota molesta]|nr:hypothetical protein BJ912DRAFT_993276 [Pholiota molesta]